MFSRTEQGGFVHRIVGGIGMSKEKLKPCPFKPVHGYEGTYWVTKDGNVINSNGKILKPYDNGYGYLIVDLNVNGKRQHKKIHRLVAEAFIPNPTNLPEVNHKDENKHNNSVKNLEWCDSSYNKTYGNGRKSRSDGMKRVWELRRADNGKL